VLHASMQSLPLFFYSFMTSSSLWSMTNGLVPHLLGPTNFYLKVLINILNSNYLWVHQDTSECCYVH